MPSAAFSLEGPESPFPLPLTWTTSSPSSPSSPTVAIPTGIDFGATEPKATENLPRLEPRMHTLRGTVGQALTPGPRVSSG